LQGANQFRKRSLEMLIGDLLLNSFQHNFYRGRCNLFGDGLAVDRREFCNRLFPGRHRQLRPIFWATLQIPEVLWLVEAGAERPRLPVGSAGLAVDNLSGGLAAVLIVEVQWNAGFQLDRRAHRTTVRADYHGLADFRKVGAWLQARNQDWDGDGYSGTAPQCGKVRVVHMLCLVAVDSEFQELSARIELR